MLFIPRPVCWTEAPESLRTLGRQRRRWHRGLAETLWLHKNMFFNPRYGVVGMLGYPYYFFIEFLAPIVEGLGYFLLPLSLIFHLVNLPFAALLLAFAFICGLSFSTGSLLIEEIAYHRYSKWSELLLMFTFAVLENFGYRQTTVIWRLQGVLDLITRTHSWGDMQRKGLKTSATPHPTMPHAALTTVAPLHAQPQSQSLAPTAGAPSQERKDVA